MDESCPRFIPDVCPKCSDKLEPLGKEKKMAKCDKCNLYFVDEESAKKLLEGSEEEPRDCRFSGALDEECSGPGKYLGHLYVLTDELCEIEEHIHKKGFRGSYRSSNDDPNVEKAWMCRFHFMIHELGLAEMHCPECNEHFAFDTGRFYDDREVHCPNCQRVVYRGSDIEEMCEVNRVKERHAEGKACYYGCFEPDPKDCEKCEEKDCTNRVSK